MAVARRGDQLAQLAAEIGVETLAVSLADEEGCRCAVAETETRLGPEEILITCAGIGSNADTVVLVCDLTPFAPEFSPRLATNSAS
jgi:NADP-dependent 3-hydroxy acid dehydrogenase YdfG